MAPERKKGKDFVTREYTVHLSKYMKGIAFKRRAPQAIKTIKRFAQKAMKTSDVRLDVRLNKAVWSQGVRNVPTRIRVVIQRRRNEDEEAKEELYSYVTVAEDQTFKNKGTVIVEDD